MSAYHGSIITQTVAHSIAGRNKVVLSLALAGEYVEPEDWGPLLLAAPCMLRLKEIDSLSAAC